jgi:hypothetical protein
MLLTGCQNEEEDFLWKTEGGAHEKKQKKKTIFSFLQRSITVKVNGWYIGADEEGCADKRK